MIAIDYFEIRFPDDEDNQINGDRYNLTCKGVPFVFENQNQLDWFEGRIKALFRDYNDREEVTVQAFECDGPEDYEETEQDKEVISRIMAEHESKNKTYYCASCHAVPVDPLNGFDTCQDCVDKI